MLNRYVFRCAKNLFRDCIFKNIIRGDDIENGKMETLSPSLKSNLDLV